MINPFHLALATGINQAMRVMRTLILAGIITLFGCVIGNAQILIYSNAFNGPASSINVAAPTVAADAAGGAASVWWTAIKASSTNYLYRNGTVGMGTGSWLLPFTPENGYIYTLTASVTFTSDPGNWLAMGFAATNPPLNTAADPRFNVTYVKGNPWSLFRPGTGNGGVQLYYSYNGLAGSANQALIPATFPNTNTINIALDTSGSQWTISETVNGTFVANYTYNSNPAITAVGVGQTTLSSSTGVKWNYMTLSATGTRTTNTVNETVSFSGTGEALNPAFVGLSYEKAAMTVTNRFTTNNVDLVNLFNLLGPTVLRIGGGTVDTTGWNGTPGTPITPALVDQFATFIKATPNVSVIYGINLESNTAANAVDEATYVKNALGSQLLGFEMGNEPEYYNNSTETYSEYLALFQNVTANIITDGYPLADTDAGQGFYSWNDSFATDEAGVVSQLTQHYYRLGGGQACDTLQTVLTADPFLVQLTTNIVGYANGHQSLGARISETGSTSAGGTLEVSDVYGAALWSLDFMFTAAVNGLQGVNFHGGGRSPYSPLNDDGVNPTVTVVGPEYYGMKMFSMLPAGNVIPATLSPTPSINFTAYGVRQTNGAISVLLNNKEVNTAVSVSVNLGTNVIGAQLITLTSSNLYCTNNYTLGGAAINVDGSWSGGVESVLATSNGQLTVSVPPITAYLLIPVSTNAPPPNAPTALSAIGGNLVVNLNWIQSTSPGITGNNVYRSINGSSGPYNLLTSLFATTSYSDTAVTAGNTYFYSVTAVNTNGESALSAYAGAITVPPAPTGLTATAGNNQVALNWTAANGGSSYNVKRATTSGGPYTTVASGVTATSYTDATVTNGTTYYYVISAVNSSGESANSSEISATPSAPTAPAAPTNLSASAGRKKVTLTWTQSTSSSITSNNVYRSTTSGGSYSLVATLSPTTTYTDTGLTSGKTYYYVVTAVNNGGESGYSNQAFATAK